MSQGEKKARSADGKRAPAAGGRGGRNTQAPAPTAAAVAAVAGPPRLRERYRREIVDALCKQFNYTSRMQVPRLVKITLNAGLGEGVGNPTLVKSMTEELTTITGQRAVACRAKKSVANFKLREGQAIGCMVTLRRERMWEFLDRLISVAMPHIRDFSGLNPRAFDGRGNYSCGMTEQIMFPEIDYDKVAAIKGFNITIVTTAGTDDEGRALMRLLGLPLKRPAGAQEG